MAEASSTTLPRVAQILQMRKRREAGGARQRRVQPDIDLGDEGWNRLRAVRQRVQDRGLPLAPVMDERAQVPLRFDDWAAVARPIDRLGASAQLVERVHIGAHRTVGRRDDRRRPGHDVIAGKQRVFLQKREAQMIGAMAGRGDGLDRVAGALPSLAVGENCVGRIVAVMGGIEAGRAIAARRERRGADHPRARRRAELLGARRCDRDGYG